MSHITNTELTESAVELADSFEDERHSQRVAQFILDGDLEGLYVYYKLMIQETARTITWPDKLPF